MNDPLDISLDSIKRSPVPSLDQGFNTDVWKQIERRRAVAAPAWWTVWGMPRIAMSGVAFAIILGASAALFDYSSTRTHRDDLEMDVFAADARHLPSGLLARLR